MINRRSEPDWTGAPASEAPSLVEHIKTLSEAMAATNVTELELVEDGLEIRLQRNPPVGAAIAGANVHSTAGQAPSPPPQHVDETPAEVTLAVMAPLTGVFYATPGPDLPPFVQVGDIVQPGQVVCMVEAMKVFNEIKTEIGGIVVAIPPKSSQLVKKGDPLVRLKPH